MRIPECKPAVGSLSLTGSETGIDLAIRALNVSQNAPDQTNAWAGWKNVSLPTGLAFADDRADSVRQNPAPTPTGPDKRRITFTCLPSSTLSSLTVTNTEGAPLVSSWVTIDTGGTKSDGTPFMPSSADTNDQQWYRVRSTGQAAVSGPARASGNRLDNSLRNTIGLVFNRKSGTFKGATRTVEVILQPLAGGGLGAWPHDKEFCHHQRKRLRR